ncbi:MAG: 5-bromo-4-chloroindolyl phosphate hydrolysis family protein, partial [Clostridiales bacterium]|nr:5-bromo-4-chloroindolyl phosphate hydrolysis family protein [Clostridiales bacterium]
VIEQREALPALYGSTDGKTAVGIVKIVGGSLLSCFGFLGFLSTIILAAVTGVSGIPAVFGLVGLGGGVGLIVNGVQGLERVGRFKKYCKTLGTNTHCALEKLARSVGKNVKFVRKELVKMIDDGLFLEGHLDREGTCLITSHDTYRHYERSRLALEQRQREELEAAKKQQETAAAADPRVQEVLQRGNAFIAEIRRCNDAIPGEEISGKISRMELIVRRIFERAQAHPEIVPDLKKLMDYYLPMTVKLLNAYAEMDAQPAQGDNIRAAKKEIEDTLDTLNLAFEKLLDSVFQDTAMDVSSDISVLNTLLAQEGLTDDELSKLKKREI